MDTPTAFRYLVRKHKPASCGTRAGTPGLRRKKSASSKPTEPGRRSVIRSKRMLSLKRFALIGPPMSRFRSVRSKRISATWKLRRGVAGLLKAMLVLKYGQIPPSLHFTKPNPHIDFEKLKLRVPTKLEPFPNGTGERIAGVNSFGFGGANAHVILAPPPAHQPEKSSTVPTSRPWPVMLSARSEKSLRTSAAKLSAWVKEHAHANGSSPVLPDLTYTLGVRRNHHPHRLTLVTSNWAELTEELDAFAENGDSAKIRAAFTARREEAPRIAFIMSGQGPQWWGMGRELMLYEPVFREAIERCDCSASAMGPLLPPRGTWSLRRNDADATDRDRSALHFCHAGGARGALEIVGHSACRDRWSQRRRNRGHLRRRNFYARRSGPNHRAARASHGRMRTRRGDDACRRIARGRSRRTRRAARSVSNDFRFQRSAFHHALGSASFARSDRLRARGAGRICATRARRPPVSSSAHATGR